VAAGALSAARAIARLAGLAFLMTASPSAASPEMAKELAPGGRLRAAINYGNPVLAQRDPTGALGGVTVDLARELGRRLDVPVDLVPFDTAGKVADSANANVWDVAFLAVDPVRANEIAFTAPYVLIEGAYMVPKDSALKTPADVDKKGIRIAVGRGSAYDLYLTRTIKNAEIVRASTGGGQASIDLFLKEKLEVAAGVRQPIAAYAKTNPDVRVMEQRFMAIEQAMGTPKGRDAAAAYLKGFVEEMKKSGFVADALKQTNQPDAQVAPAAN
jgi:polar amino acid transport system substrate-binding protein